ERHMNEKRSRTVNSSYINRLNKISVLRLIRDEGRISRAEIAKKTELSAPTITRIADDLISKEKLISLVGEGESKGGRRPKMLRFNSKENFVIGIDLRATCIRGALSNLDGELILEREVPTKLEDGYEKIMEQIGSVINSLILRGGDKGAKVLGIGLAVAGSVNRQTGIIERAPVFNWKNVDVVSGLKAYTPLPVFCDNVSRLMALGELWYGLGSGYQDFICVNLDHEISAGMIINGKPLFGSNGYAGEFGRSILEHGSSSIGLSQMVEGELAKREASAVLKEKTGSAYKVGGGDKDKVELKLCDKSIDYLAVVLDTLIKLFNPECIILSGGLTRTKEFLLDKLEKEVRKYSIPNLSANVKVIGSSFGENAALMGTFSLILNKILNLEIKVI
ncbi:ROK family transcriptional regulator, partial [Seonamhaeicola sp.]|uniref:ROK family transcriptional regulator n=1 Tax=Seonamhaeicola sp. TaxID=1912245 RepID=UPI00261C5FA1